MKKLIPILFLIILGGGMHVQAQSTSLSAKEQKKLLKEEKKRVAAEQAKQQAQLVAYMTKSGRFVLEADMLFDRYGQSYQVSSNINFLMLDSIFGIIQVGNNFSMGSNGVGGFTMEGSVDDYEVNYNEKRKVYNIKYTVKSFRGNYTVSMFVLPSGKADASVSGSFTGGSLKYSGRLVHPAASRVYKGSAL